jgi:hypothetical protein
VPNKWKEKRLKLLRVWLWVIFVILVAGAYTKKLQSGNGKIETVLVDTGGTERPIVLASH